jgi:hypothetical protein
VQQRSCSFDYRICAGEQANNKDEQTGCHATRCR